MAPLLKPISSPTHSVPLLSKARLAGSAPAGAVIVTWGTGPPFEAACAGVYSTIVPPLTFATHRLPCASKASPLGPLIELLFVPIVSAGAGVHRAGGGVQLGPVPVNCPAVYSRMCWLPLSATHMLPFASKASV